MRWVFVRFIKDHGSSHDVCCVCLEWHGFHLFGVLKGVFLGLLVLFCCCTGLECGSVIANGLQVCSISPVDSAIGACDCVWMTTILIFCSQFLLTTLFNLFLVCLERTLLVYVTFRTQRFLALCDLSKVLFLAVLDFYQSLMQICFMLIHFGCLESTAPCAGLLWRISAGDGRSVAMGVSHNWSNALAWAVGEPSVFL